MSSDLGDALGAELANLVAVAPESERAAVAEALADRALQHVGLTVRPGDDVSALADDLDSRYFDLQEVGDPEFDREFRRARAASAAVAERRADVGRAAYEALHAGVPRSELSALARERLS